MNDKIQTIIERYYELGKRMEQPDFAGDLKKMQEVSREYSDIGKKLPSFKKYLDTLKVINDSEDILKTESDTEILELAKEELAAAKEYLPEIEKEVQILLIPKDESDGKNAILEIRAGTGGDEAGLFTGDLYRMYQYYAESRKWKTEIMSLSEGEKDSVKEVILLVSGEDVYGSLKYESGVHRVQRVPETETQGRIHTSAASVVVLPESDDVDVVIEEKDLRIDYFRASGAGGQHINKTDSAVRLTHFPSGLVVSCQDERSQIKNKAKAMKILQSRLLDLEIQKKQASETSARRSMVGTGDRSAKIRTYNFPQGRVTDHRINLTLYKLNQVMTGDIQELITALAQADLQEKIAARE
ncbi:MAG: peptide chain release factor 1 [Chitinispirillales bacterium]|jgi:peptide chain release factor 1|nr:peptide chain release factor 1 [Chitinispirillales bacterium]